MKKPIIRTSNAEQREVVLRALYALGYRFNAFVDVEDAVKRMRIWAYGDAYILVRPWGIIRQISAEYKDHKLADKYQIANSITQMVRMLRA